MLGAVAPEAAPASGTIPYAGANAQHLGTFVAAFVSLAVARAV